MHRSLLRFGPRRCVPLVLTILILGAGATPVFAETVYGPVVWAGDGSICAHYMGRLQRLVVEPKGVRALSDSVPPLEAIAISEDGARIAAAYRAGAGRAHVTVYDAARSIPLYSLLETPDLPVELSFDDSGDVVVGPRDTGAAPLVPEPASLVPEPASLVPEPASGERIAGATKIPGRGWTAAVYFATAAPDTSGLTRVEVRDDATGAVQKSFRTATRGVRSEREYIGPISVALDPDHEHIFIQWPRAGCQIWRFADWKLIAHWR